MSLQSFICNERLSYEENDCDTDDSSRELIDRSSTDEGTIGLRRRSSVLAEVTVHPINRENVSQTFLNTSSYDNLIYQCSSYDRSQVDKMVTQYKTPERPQNLEKTSSDNDLVLGDLTLGESLSSAKNARVAVEVRLQTPTGDRSVSVSASATRESGVFEALVLSHPVFAVHSCNIQVRKGKFS